MLIETSCAYGCSNGACQQAPPKGCTKFQIAKGLCPTSYPVALE